MKYHCYLISQPAEETSCGHCGYPLFVGDNSWECVQTGEVKNEVVTSSAGYCSYSCAKKEAGPASP